MNLKRRPALVALLAVLAFGPLFSLRTSAQVSTLNAVGPWLIYTIQDDQGWANQLWAANPDGSAPTELVNNKSIAGFAVAPSGGLVAYIAADYPPGGSEGYIKPVLNL